MSSSSNAYKCGKCPECFASSQSFMSHTCVTPEGGNLSAERTELRAEMKLVRDRQEKMIEFLNEQYPGFAEFMKGEKAA